MQNGQNEEKVDLRCILDGDIAKRFLKIKHSKGLNQNTEVIRAIINDYFNDHFKEG